MSIEALDHLHDAFIALRTALDGDDVTAIEAASKRVGRAVDELKGVGAWRDEPAVRLRLSEIAPLMEATRVRTSMLADHNRQRLSMLAARGSNTAPLTYGRGKRV